MNHVESRSFAQLLSDYRDAPAGELRDLRHLALKAFVEGYARRAFRALVDGRAAVRVDTDTVRAKAESLARLMNEARLLAGELVTELRTVDGRAAARTVEEVLGRGGAAEFSRYGLGADNAELDKCCGELGVIADSLRPHIEAPNEYERSEEPQTSAEAP
jgi:hypothetical protein